MRQVLKGGLADRKNPSDFCPKALRAGQKVESEHTGNKQMASEIAMDHLTEDPRYYEKLKKMEKSASLLAFSDELLKISGVGGAYAREVASKGARGLKKGIVNQGNNIGKTLVAMGNPKKALKQGWDATFRPDGKPVGTGYKLFMAGSAAMGAQGALSKKDPMGMNRSRLRRTTGFIGDQVGGLMGAPFGLAGGITGGVIGGKVGDTAGKVIDKVRRYKPKPPQPTNLPPRPQGLNEAG